MCLDKVLNMQQEKIFYNPIRALKYAKKNNLKVIRDYIPRVNKFNQVYREYYYKVY